jgi:hypothetical protein
MFFIYTVTQSDNTENMNVHNVHTKTWFAQSPDSPLLCGQSFKIIKLETDSRNKAGELSCSALFRGGNWYKLHKPYTRYSTQACNILGLQFWIFYFFIVQ